MGGISVLVVLGLFMSFYALYLFLILSASFILLKIIFLKVFFFIIKHIQRNHGFLITVNIF